MKSAIIFFALVIAACSKSSGVDGGTVINHAPLASLAASITNINPFTVDFTVTASDQDGDAVTYNWDFGEGTKKQGAATESFTYAEGKIYIAKVTVSDGTANVIASASVNTTVTSITVDAAVKFQTMEGFGGFGAKDVYWSSGPFTSPEFVSTLLDDLGLTILRDNIPENFEYTNDNSDPYVTDLTKFNISNNTQGVDGNLSNHLEYLKAMHDAGLQKLIVSIWSAPAWMKTNNMTSNGTQQNSAPPYNPNATSADNQLRTDMYEEFAEMCVAYIKIIKQETGIDVYALSIQNEPRFSQFYASCVYNGEALRDVLKVVGKRFKDEGITTKLFLPEDIGYLDGVSGMIQPTLNDADARQYADIVAVHGYALDGVTANSPDAITWQTMYSWGAAYGIPLWMTETSGFSNDMKGAMDIAKAMYTAINFGNISAWLHWELSQQTLDEYSLMSSSGQKSKRYYASKNFYRYVRPGDYRIQASADASANIYPLAFKNDTAATNTIVLINDNAIDRAIKLSGAALPAQFEMFVTSATDDCKSYGTVNSSDNILLPANSVITLYHKN